MKLPGYYTLEALLYCFLRLNFSGMAVVWDFWKIPDEWEEIKEMG